MLGSVVSPVMAANSDICQIEQGKVTEKEKKKAIAKAFTDKGVQKLRKELIEMGFKVEKIDVNKVKMEGKEETLVTMFYTRGKDLAVLSYVDTDNVYAGLFINGGLKVFKYDPYTGQTTLVTTLGWDWYEICMDLCQIFCGGYFGVSCAFACEITGWFAPICIYVICPILTYYVEKYGCSSGCEDLCEWAT